MTLSEPGKPAIAVQRQSATSTPRADVIYVHGGTFGADLSIFFALDGYSWADSLVAAGFRVWGFDFVGYGASDRYCATLDRPAGDIAAALRDLHRVVARVRSDNGNEPVVLLAHSRGGAVAARYASEHAASIASLVLFAPIIMRPASAPARQDAAPAQSHYPLSVWAQYRRFIEDVPRGQPQVLDEAHMQAWGAAFLASDPASAFRTPPSVRTPLGPLADITALRGGKALYDPGGITAPTLLIRGEWDSLCTDADAQRLIARLAALVKRDVKVPGATHLMHLEQRRHELYGQVNRFLREVSGETPVAQ